MRKDERQTVQLPPSMAKRLHAIQGRIWDESDEKLSIPALINLALDAFESTRGSKPVTEKPISGTGIPQTDDGAANNTSCTIAPEYYQGRPHELLAKILDGAPMVVRGAILSNLEAFSLVTEAMGGQVDEDAEFEFGPDEIGRLTKAIADITRRSKGAAGSKKPAPRKAAKRGKTG